MRPLQPRASLRRVVLALQALRRTSRYIIPITALAGSLLQAQTRPSEFRFHAGSTIFLESTPHFSAGASYRHYLGKSSWAIEPEYSFMTEGNHQDNLLIANVVKDLARFSEKSVLYMIMGGGVNFYRAGSFGETGLGGLGWGLGLKIGQDPVSSSRRNSGSGANRNCGSLATWASSAGSDPLCRKQRLRSVLSELSSRCLR